MPLPVIFGPLTTINTPQFDQDFAALGQFVNIAGTIAGTNALVLTPSATAPSINSYSPGQVFSGIATATSTGPVTMRIAPNAVLNVYIDTFAGPVVLKGGEIVQNNAVSFAYDPTLNSGAGGFHLGQSVDVTPPIAITVAPTGGDDTISIQTAINVLSQANGGRGGTVQLTPGLYTVSSTLNIQSQGNLRIAGVSPTADEVYNLASGTPQYGASSIVYTGVGGSAAFTVSAADPATGWKTIGVTFENFGVINAATTTDGFLLQGTTGGPGTDQYDIYFKGVGIFGGNCGVHLTGDDTFNIQIDGLEINFYNNGIAPNWGIYSDLTNGPAICTVWKNLRIVHTNIGHIYIAGIGWQIGLDSCTLEACGLSSIVAPLSVGQLSLWNCHWEQVGNSAYWNGTSYQNSAGDATPVAPFLIGSVAGGNSTSSIAIRDCSIETNRTGGGGTAVYVLPVMVSYDSSVIEIQGGHIGPIGLGINQGQPYFVRNANEAQITMRDVQCEPMDTGVLPIGGNQTAGGLRLIRIDNCKGLLAYPIIQPTNGTGDYGANDFAGVRTDIIRRQAVQPTGSALSLLSTRIEMTIPNVGWLTTPNIAQFGSFNQGDILWCQSATEFGQPVAFICMANNVVTFVPAQWYALLPQSIALQAILPGYSASITPDCLNGSWLFISASDGNAFTINAPLNGGVGGFELTITIQNPGAGALGTPTWNTAYRMNAWTQPAAFSNKSITFKNFASNWIQVSPNPVDVPN